MSFYDPLTNLPNQELFRANLTRALTLTREQRRKTAAIVLSIDRFKTFNDTLGHAVSDQLLRGVSERLSACGNGVNAVAHLGGDEFAILQTHISDAADAIEMTQKIQAALRPPFEVGGHKLYLTASLGISLHPDDGAEAQSLLQNASAALFQAQQQGGDGYQFYSADIKAAAFKRLTLESDLRRALEREEFEVYYQPQVSADTGRVCGMEALVRWHHPERGLVSPAEFIPLAEDTGLIVPLGEWVLRTACAQNKAWRDEGFVPLRVAVNLSARQFEQPALAEMVKHVLDETGLDANCLELELTESAVMKNAELTVGILAELKQTDVQISIDDFGTGYSSLSYLKRFPINKLKIDQSFVGGATTNQSDAEIVRAVITLAHSLKLKVTAEGVETKEQLAFLHLLKCDEMQGYLFSRPLPAKDFRELLLRGGGWSGQEGAANPARSTPSLWHNNPETERALPAKIA